MKEENIEKITYKKGFLEVLNEIKKPYIHKFKSIETIDEIFKK